MGKTRRAQPVVETFAAHQIITPPNRLKKAIRKAKAGDVDPVANAEAALASLSQHFAGWMEAEWRRLDVARREIGAAGDTAPAWQELFRTAHDIKGEALTFGFPQVEAIAESLCRLVEYARHRAGIPRDLIDRHVDAMHALVHLPPSNVATLENEETIRDLSRAAAEYLVSEDVDALGETEKTVSPPLAPV